MTATSPLSSCGLASQPERGAPPRHFVDEGRRLVEVLDRAAPLLFGDYLHRAVLGEDTDVVADLGDGLVHPDREFFGTPLSFAST